MLTKDDYENYLRQIAKVELTMADLYREYASQVDDEEIKALFKQLSQEEHFHHGLVQKISELIGSGASS